MNTPAAPAPRSFLDRAAQIVSDVLSPLAVPTYCMAMAMWITPLQILPERTRMGATLGVAFITGVLPLCVLLLMLRAGMVSDLSLSHRRQRLVPMLVTVVAYLGAALYLHLLHAPVWLVAFFIGASVATTLAGLITVKWKISAHGCAMGGMAGMMLWLAAARMATVNAMLWLSIVIVLGGLVGTSRLILDRHTPAQVACGWLLGAVAVFLTTNFLQS
ncbi:MAG: phosphatase PAP2 family protein [Muribaculaceae bacterium]|nr:phosphatase PAP2 family protein [Muribaculaceae bacterium]